MRCVKRIAQAANTGMIMFTLFATNAAIRYAWKMWSFPASNCREAM